MCRLSCVTRLVSHVTCHMSFFLFFFCGQRFEVYWWRVCYQRGLPRLVLVFLGQKHKRKEYNLAKMTNVWTIPIVKSKPHFIDVSSNEYCPHIHQMEALVKTFLLHVVSNSGIFGSNLWIWGTSGQGLQSSAWVNPHIQVIWLGKKGGAGSWTMTKGWEREDDFFLLFKHYDSLLRPYQKVNHQRPYGLKGESRSWWFNFKAMALDVSLFWYGLICDSLRYFTKTA